MTQEVLKMALEALIWTTGSGDFGEGGQAHEGAKKCLFPAITAIKEALAQPEQEPVAWMDVDGKTFPFVWNVSSLGVQQGSKYLDESLTPLYTHPPQRTWVGLTRMDLIKCGVLPFGMSYELCQAIESKLKNKNT